MIVLLQDVTVSLCERITYRRNSYCRSENCIKRKPKSTKHKIIFALMMNNFSRGSIIYPPRPKIHEAVHSLKAFFVAAA